MLVRISFSGVDFDGGGVIDFLSELNLEGAGMVVQHGSVFFQREFGASILTGSGKYIQVLCGGAHDLFYLAGDLIILKPSFVSFGIESNMNGTGDVQIYGDSEIPEFATISSERKIRVDKGKSFQLRIFFFCCFNLFWWHTGGKIDVYGKLLMKGEVIESCNGNVNIPMTGHFDGEIKHCNL